MLILHPRDQPPIGGAYQPADWDAPLADDPFFSLSLSSLKREREEEKETRRGNETPQTANVRSFVRQLRVGRRPFSTASEERPTTKSKPDVQRSIDRVASKRIDPLASLALRSIQFSSVPLFVARTLTARLTVSVAHLRSISRVSSVRGALTTRGVASSSPRPSPRGFFLGGFLFAASLSFGHSDICHVDGLENPKKTS
jgi:hypothetical protein